MEYLIIGLIGGVSAGIAFSIKRNVKFLNKFLYIIVFIGVFSGLKFTNEEYLEPYLKQQEIDNSLSKIAFYSIIKEYDPVAYKKIEFLLTSSKARMNKKQVKEKLNDFLLKYIYSERLKFAPTEEILSFYLAQIDTLKYYRGIDKVSCFNYMFPQFKEEVNLKSIPEEVKLKMSRAIEEVIESSYKNPITRDPYNFSAEKGFLEVRTNLFEKYGDKVNLMSNPQKLKSEEDKYLICDISIDFYSEILKLNKEDASSILSSLLD